MSMPMPGIFSQHDNVIGIAGKHTQAMVIGEKKTIVNIYLR